MSKEEGQTGRCRERKPRGGEGVKKEGGKEAIIRLGNGKAIKRNSQRRGSDMAAWQDPVRLQTEEKEVLMSSATHFTPFGHLS